MTSYTMLCKFCAQKKCWRHRQDPLLFDCLIAFYRIRYDIKNIFVIYFMAKKRMVTTKSSTINWSSCSLQDLESIKDQVVKAIAHLTWIRINFGIDSASNQRYVIQTKFNSLTGDSSTYREVHILESLDLDRIAEAIKSTDDVNIDVDQRWTLAIGLSNLVCSMIHVADGMYGKPVSYTHLTLPTNDLV